MEPQTHGVRKYLQAWPGTFVSEVFLEVWRHADHFKSRAQVSSGCRQAPSRRAFYARPADAGDSRGGRARW
jgi:hypothetical protein